MFKKLSILLIILLLPAFAYAGGAMGLMMAASGGATAGCTPSTPGNDYSEIGYLTVGSSNAATLIDRIYCFLYVPDCSGSLGTGYLYGSDDTTALAKISAFSTTDTDPDIAPTNGSRIGYTAELSFDSTPAWQSAAMSGGSVVTTASYWICAQTKNGNAPTLYYDAGKVRHSLNVTGQYTTPPALLPVAGDCVGSADPYSCCTGAGTGCTWSTTADRMNSVFIGID